jgi:hypothetical protein
MIFIKLKDLLPRMLLERMTFKDLLGASDPARARRAGQVRSKSLGVTSEDGGETWNFKYKSYPSTTGHPHQGRIQFYKEDVSNIDSFEDLECIADCSCPDYRYKWAYNNTKAGAGMVGNKSLNGNNGQAPKPYNDLGPGLCKHLIALSEYLNTEIEPEAPEETPEPEVEKPSPELPSKRKEKELDVDTSYDDSSHYYSDSREEGDRFSDSTTELEEGSKSGSLYQKMENFIKLNPSFNVAYYDE